VTVARQFWALAVGDVAVADWYVEMLGLTRTATLHQPDGSVVAIVEDDARIVEVKQRSARADREPLAEGYLKVGWFVPSVADEHARLAAAGAAPGPIVEQPEHGIRFFFVADPEGNTLQLFEAVTIP
jgi:catechol 2,3-dioxygenase-like lactoylglutathione lyase family enzyme